jgi:hypothetical protein
MKVMKLCEVIFYTTSYTMSYIHIVYDVIYNVVYIVYLYNVVDVVSFPDTIGGL